MKNFKRYYAYFIALVYIFVPAILLCVPSIREYDTKTWYVAAFYSSIIVVLYLAGCLIVIFSFIEIVRCINQRGAGQHPMGLRYPISFMTRNLSSGQNQQLLLARSLSSDACIYLWDEPTSNMDETTEQKIFDNLDYFISGKTLVMVTHRRYLLKYFDRVLVMKNGKIIRDCTPDKLIGETREGQPAQAKRVQVHVPVNNI